MTSIFPRHLHKWSNVELFIQFHVPNWSKRSKDISATMGFNQMNHMIVPISHHTEYTHPALIVKIFFEVFTGFLSEIDCKSYAWKFIGWKRLNTTQLAW